MASIVVDFGYDTNFEAELAQFAAEANVKPFVIKRHGPGGGRPEVEMRGTYAAIKALAIEWFVKQQGEDEDWALTLIAD